MGRNKNKDNRSAARRNNGIAGMISKKKDTGLPAYFKQRRLAGLQANETQSRLKMKEEDDVEMNESNIDFRKDSVNRNQNGVLEEARDPFQFDKAARDLSLSGKRDSSAKAFMKDLKNVIENSDVILQVLDARDPLGSRSRQTEVMAMGSGKKVVLILNKVDLIPVANLQGWLKYLRNDFPTLAFKASTQEQRGNLKQGKASLSIVQSVGKSTGEKSTSPTLSFGSEAVGAAALLQLLKNYSRTSAKGSNLKQQLTVGVIGPPNVGKSSLINSLLRTRACAVASTPGWTKVIQGVMLEKGIRLLDCPGVIVTGGEMNQEIGLDSEQAKMNNAWNVLRNTIKVELIQDPITPVQALMSRVEAEQLSNLYNIEGGFNESDAHDFLLRVALMRGKLGKGGIPDLEGAARIVLHDWNIGKISYFSKVPTVHRSALVGSNKSGNQAEGATDDSIAGTSLLSSLGEAFDLEALLGQADAEALGGDNGRESSKTSFQPRERKLLPIAEGSQDSAIVEDDEEIERTRESIKSTTSSTLGKRSRKRDMTIDSDSEDEEEANVLDVEENSIDDEQMIQSSNNNPTVESGEYYDRRQQKAECLTNRKRDLLTVFSPIELQGMAQRRSDVRKAAKKKKKRLHRSEAGLVDVWNQGMILPPSDKSNLQSSKKSLFDVVDAASTTQSQIEEEEEEL